MSRVVSYYLARNEKLWFLRYSLLREKTFFSINVLLTLYSLKFFIFEILWKFIYYIKVWKPTISFGSTKPPIVCNVSKPLIKYLHGTCNTQPCQLKIKKFVCEWSWRISSAWVGTYLLGQKYCAAKRRVGKSQVCLDLQVNLHDRILKQPISCHWFPQFHQSSWKFPKFLNLDFNESS